MLLCRCWLFCCFLLSLSQARKRQLYRTLVDLTFRTNSICSLCVWIHCTLSTPVNRATEYSDVILLQHQQRKIHARNETKHIEQPYNHRIVFTALVCVCVCILYILYKSHQLICQMRNYIANIRFLFAYCSSDKRKKDK